MRALSFRVVSVIVLFLFLGCSGDKQSAKPDAKKESTETASTHKTQLAKIPDGGTLEDTLSFWINEAMTRLKYGDKTAFYENELRYYTDEHTLDEYLRLPEIQRIKPDSLENVDVLGLIRFPKDSVYVDVRVNFMGKKGVITSLRDTIPMYYHSGRWRRSFVSRFGGQVEYDALIKQAQEDAGK